MSERRTPEPGQTFRLAGALGELRKRLVPEQIAAGGFVPDPEGLADFVFVHRDDNRMPIFAREGDQESFGWVYVMHPGNWAPYVLPVRLGRYGTGPEPSDDDVFLWEIASPQSEHLPEETEVLTILDLAPGELRGQENLLYMRHPRRRGRCWA